MEINFLDPNDSTPMPIVCLNIKCCDEGTSTEGDDHPAVLVFNLTFFKQLLYQHPGTHTYAWRKMYVKVKELFTVTPVSTCVIDRTAIFRLLSDVI